MSINSVNSILTELCSPLNRGEGELPLDLVVRGEKVRGGNIKDCVVDYSLRSGCQESHAVFLNFFLGEFQTQYWAILEPSYLAHPIL